MNEIVGMAELKGLLNRLGSLPQKCVTSASRKGAVILRNAIKSSAPVETGMLKQGIKIIGEKSQYRGKKVYQAVFDRDMNDVFVKTSKAGKRAYYPASQEYGFQTRNGGYVPGYHFMRKSADENAPKVETTIVSELAKNVDKELSR